MAIFSYPSTLALFSILSTLAFMSSPAEASTICTFLPFLRICNTPPPPPPPPPPFAIGGSPSICNILPRLCRTPPPPPPPPPPPSVIGGSSLIVISITGTLTCPFISELPSFILLRNATVDLRCRIGSSTTTTALLATTLTNDAGNYVFFLDATATALFDLSTCVLAITSPGNSCVQGRIPSVPLRLLGVDGGVVIVTSPLFGN